MPADPPTPKKPLGAVVDKLRGVAAEEQRRFDQPQRRSTLQGMPAQRLPDAPALPLEHSATLRAGPALSQSGQRSVVTAAAPCRR